MYISQKLSAPDEKRLRLVSQLGVYHVAIDDAAAVTSPIPTVAATWDARLLLDYRRRIESFDLTLDAFALDIGSILPDALTDLERARKKRDVLAANIRKAGDASIPCLSYHTQIAGTSRTGLKPGRGGILMPSFVGTDHIASEAGSERTVTGENSAWDAIEFLLEGLLPAADAAGVRLACRPQDPACPAAGRDDIAHVTSSPDGLRRFLALSPSRHHGLDFCQCAIGTMFKEPAKAVVPMIEEFASTGRIFMVQFRNIRGGYLDFDEVFPDEGDIDMFQAIKAYQRGGYAGPLYPGALPVSPLDESGEKLGAFALGYTRGLLQAAGVSSGLPKNPG